jgi:hypothetical protein
MGKEVLVPMYNCRGLKREMVPESKFAAGIGFRVSCTMSYEQNAFELVT